MPSTEVKTVAFDVLIPSYLYASLDNGDVVVFNTKWKPSGEVRTNNRVEPFHL